jgi:biopolymer transport protein ExbD
MEFKEKRKKDIHLDITPIVDTVFNLLIFFALSLNFTFTSSLNINLPEVSSKEIIGEAKRAIIQITKKGEVFLNQSKVNNDSLSEMLQKIKLKTPLCNIVIQADERVPHGKVVSVMDICKKAGFNKISIAAYLK